MTDEDLLALNVFEEAGGEINDGRAAVARVVKNRMAHKYHSDGTVTGTVLAPSQFSWAWFDFRGGKYTRVAWALEGAQQIADMKLAVAPQRTLAACKQIAGAVMAGTYEGPLYDMLTDDVLLYLNANIITALPNWATPDKMVCKIGRHTFYTK